MQKLTIALLQILPGKTIQENMRIGHEYCRKAQAMGADIALFPEMWSTGYTIPDTMEAVKAAAIRSDDTFINSFKQLASELNMAIGITFLEQHTPLPRNTLCVFDRFGRCVLTYAKVHTCDFAAEKRLTAGDDFYIANLDTANGTVKIGAMICYDREFPESARILMLKGAEIILVPNACPMEINRLSQLRTRAFENMVGIATANYPKGHSDCNGHSSGYDGIAFLQDEGSRDMLVIEAGEEAGLYTASFDIDALRDYRQREAFGNAYRHPAKYRILISEEKYAPFIRPDYRK